jgi:prepilin signal peptidase PulO-like enzyme (type II secretory pathway)
MPLPVACAFVGSSERLSAASSTLIHRIPLQQSIVFPTSKCPKCLAAIRAYDNIPVISYLILRGRCRACRAGISARYPAVEAITGLLFAAVTWHDGVSFALPFDLAFAAALVALIFIDSEHMLLPNAITYPGFLFALLTCASLSCRPALTIYRTVELLSHAAAVAGFFDRRRHRSDRRRRLALADGLLVGKAAGS